MAILAPHGETSSTQSDAAGAAHALTKRAADAEVDRVQQKGLLAALNAWGRALRRDECGAWCIDGKRGSIHTWGDGKTWVLFVAAARAVTGQQRRCDCRSAT